MTMLKGFRDPYTSNRYQNVWTTDSFFQLALFGCRYSILLINILHGIMVSQKYWATSMLTKEIPIEIRKIIGGVIEFKMNTFLKLGLKSP